ncbi:DUF86 domain-containing protein [Bacillaceae bacterium]
MYQVNKPEIEHTLRYLEEVLPVLQGIAEQEDPFADRLLRFAAERAVHVSIEAVVDVGNLLIDGFIMRDPGSYVDIIDILQDERVIPDDVAADLREWVAFRRPLIQGYKRVDANALLALIRTSLTGLKLFPGYVRKYLQQELGS